MSWVISDLFQIFLFLSKTVEESASSQKNWKIATEFLKNGPTQHRQFSSRPLMIYSLLLIMGHVQF